MTKKKTRKPVKKVHKRKTLKPRAIFKTSKRKQKHTKTKKLVKPVKKSPPKPLVGIVSHYFTNIGVGVVELTKPLKVGDKILIDGTTTKFEQKVESMQIDRVPVLQAQKGDAIGLKVKKRVRDKDRIYLVK